MALDNDVVVSYFLKGHPLLLLASYMYRHQV